MKIQLVRGTHDYFGIDLKKIKFIEKKIRNRASSFGFNEIVTPIFESSNLFKKPLGEHSDVVLKEMYSFKDRNNTSLTLRPEYTTPIIRAAISNKLLNKLPRKIFGIGSMFRRERPQKGRFRQFNQMNFEILGSDDSLSDFELILIAKLILQDVLPNQEFSLSINSLGDGDTLNKYKNNLSNYFKKYKSDLSDDSKSKIESNPLRILDSKDSKDIKIGKDAPLISEVYSKKAAKVFEEVQGLLSESKISFHVNSKLVRGLDYYCHTVFEFKSNKLGSQDTVIGGGRYDGLVKVIGGPDIPGVGFAGGLERLMLLMDSPKIKNIQNHLIVIDKNLKNYGVNIYNKLHENNIPIYWDYKFNLKKSLSIANEKKASFAIIIGEDEYNKKKYTLKNLTKSFQEMLTIDELITKLIK
tara:strand:- start:592 stop:1827 length:1236 start_codon:yes stop_codon:yes gene_type:complete